MKWPSTQQAPWLLLPPNLCHMSLSEACQPVMRCQVAHRLAATSPTPYDVEASTHISGLTSKWGSKDHKMCGTDRVACHQTKSTWTSLGTWCCLCLLPLSTQIVWERPGRNELPTMSTNVTCWRVPWSFAVSSRETFREEAKFKRW